MDSKGQSGAEALGIGRRYSSATLAKIDLPHDIAVKVLKWTKKESGFLVFQGNPGIGKTYLAAALCNMWYDQKKWVRYFTACSFLSKLREVIGLGFDPIREVNTICEAHYLIIDDLGSNLNNSDWQREMFFHTIDVRYTSNYPTAVFTNLTKEQITETYTDRTTSRLFSEDSTLISVFGPDRRAAD